LQLRAKTRFENKENLDEGWKDILASARLFRFVTINQAWQKTLKGTDDETVLAYAAEGVPVKGSLLTPVVEIAATLPHWTPEQLEQAIKDLESLPAWRDRQTTLKMIQFALLDLLAATNNLTDNLDVFASDVDHGERQFLEAIQYIAIDRNRVARELNRGVKEYSELLERAEGQSLNKQFELLNLREPGVHRGVRRESPSSPEEWTAYIVDVLDGDSVKVDVNVNPLIASGRSNLLGVMAGRVLIPQAAGELFRQQLMEESRCQALRLAMALELYHREHQRYPDSLDALNLKAMPMDVHFEYERRGDGYRLRNKLFELER
jgi:hypothetical protein